MLQYIMVKMIETKNKKMFTLQRKITEFNKCDSLFLILDVQETLVHSTI